MKITRILLLVLTVCLLAGCAATPPVSTGDPIEETTTPPTYAAYIPDAPVYPDRVVAPLPESVTVGDLISPYWEETLRWDDTDGEHCVFPVAVPQIYPFSEDAIRCEKEIFDHLFPILDDALNKMGIGISQSLNQVGYEAYLNGQILSLIVSQETPNDLHLYQVYNFDTASGKKLDGADLLAYLGISRDDFHHRADTAVRTHFAGRFGEKEAAADPTFYQAQLNRSTNESNLDHAELYLDAAGRLMMVADIYPLAGASRYPTPLPLETENQ